MSTVLFPLRIKSFSEVPDEKAQMMLSYFAGGTRSPLTPNPVPLHLTVGGNNSDYNNSIGLLCAQFLCCLNGSNNPDPCHSCESCRQLHGEEVPAILQNGRFNLFIIQGKKPDDAVLFKLERHLYFNVNPWDLVVLILDYWKFPLSYRHRDHNIRTLMGKAPRSNWIITGGSGGGNTHDGFPFHFYSVGVHVWDKT